jgi:hypothetical protein
MIHVPMLTPVLVYMSVFGILPYHNDSIDRGEFVSTNPGIFVGAIGGCYCYNTI